MLRQERLKIFCKVSIEEAYKKHNIKIVILKVMSNHVHMIVDCPRTISEAMLMQIIKELSSFILFRLCPFLRKIYLKGHFWNKGYFCCAIEADFDRVFSYIENQELHHITYSLWTLSPLGDRGRHIISPPNSIKNKFVILP